MGGGNAPESCLPTAIKTEKEEEEEIEEENEEEEEENNNTSATDAFMPVFNEVRRQ